MTIFMVAVLPLALGLILYAHYPEEFRRTEFWGAFLRGILVSIAAFLVYIIIKNLVNDEFEFGKLFGIHLIHDYAFFFLAALGGYVLFFGTKSKGSSFDHFPIVLMYMAGTQILLPVADLIMKSGWFDIYSLFLLPVLRACLCLIVAMILTWSVHSYGPVKYVLLACAILPPVILTFVPALWGINQYIAASVVTAFAVAIAALAYLLTRRSRV